MRGIVHLVTFVLSTTILGAQNYPCNYKVSLGITASMIDNPDTVCAIWLRDRREIKKIHLFTNAKVLWADYRGISKLPNEIVKLTELQSIELNLNKIRKLPENFGNLKNLTDLDLQANKIKCLPESFKELNNLENLNLSLNNLKSCEVLLEMTNLQSVNLFGNPLKSEFIKRLRQELPNCTIIF